MRTVGLLAASNNAHKLTELREITSLYAPRELSVAWLAPRELGLDIEPDESAPTYAGNALLKGFAFAHAARNRAGLLAVVADDSGLEVDALAGRPGILSSRYFKAAPNGDGCAALLNELSGAPTERRAARFRCAIALISLNGGQRVFEGACEGRIAFAPRGAGGFGFDPVFIVEDGGFDGARTMAELSSDEKHSVSHRGRALRALLQHLANWR